MADLVRWLRPRPAWRRPSALAHFKSNLASANSHPLAAFLSFSDEAAEIGLGPDWLGMVTDVEAEGSRLIGAVPCPLPHGTETPDGRVLPFENTPLGPCPSCGAAL